MSFTPKPLKVVLKLSDKSFLRPLSGGSDMRQDICVNIFFNGEFNTSEIISYSVWSGKGNSQCQYYGGRRIEIRREVPWVIDFTAEHCDESLRHRKDGSVKFSSSQRWQKLADLLRNEAEKWGKDDSGYRNPTADYLEMIAKKPMPSELDTSQDPGGARFGVIDIVLTVGCASYRNCPNFLSSPSRKLSIKEIQKELANSTPESLRPSRKHSASVVRISFGSNSPNFSENAQLPNYEKSKQPVYLFHWQDSILCSNEVGRICGYQSQQFGHRP